MPTLAEWLAPEDSPDTQAGPLERTMAFNRFARVNRATGGETTLLPKYGTQPVAIKFDQCQQELFQLHEVLIRVDFVSLLHIGLAPDVKLSYNFVAFRELKLPEL